jgi:hypothetical protein
LEHGFFDYVNFNVYGGSMQQSNEEN